MSQIDQSKIAHLEMIQGVITRMASNSFALKTLMVMLTAGVLAFTGAVTSPSPTILLAALLPLVLMWCLDAQYLRLERLFRRLYDAVRKNEETEPFTMDIGPYRQIVPQFYGLAVTWSVLAFYAPIAIVMIVLFFILSP